MGVKCIDYLRLFEWFWNCFNSVVHFGFHFMRKLLGKHEEINESHTVFFYADF